MKFLKSAPLFVLSAWLAGTTSLCSNGYAACVNCGQTPEAPVVKRSIFPNARITRTEIFPSAAPAAAPASSSRNGAGGPIFGTDDCSAGNGPMFGDNTCTRRKCGGAMFGPQTCKRLDLPCEDCKTDRQQPAAPRRAFIQNYKTLPSDNIYDRIHKCSDLASFQLEWVDFRIRDGRSDTFSRNLGNYRFRLFGCRRFSKKAKLNEGRIIQKNMQFIDIFEDIVGDCYNIVKVPSELCLRDQDYEAPEYILTAEITDYFMNVCDGYDWNNAAKEDRRTGSAEMTVTWRLMDLTKSKVLWKGETTGYSELQEGEYNGEIALIEQAFADASSNIKGLPEFENQLAVRVDPDTLEQQKTTLLAQEQAADPVKCKVPAQKAETCPLVDEKGNAVSMGGYADGTNAAKGQNGQQQCTMPAEILEYEGQERLSGDTDAIPLEFGTGRKQIPYAENSGSICYGYNNDADMFNLNAATIGSEINNSGDLVDNNGGTNGRGYIIGDGGAASGGGYNLTDNGGICDATLTSYLDPVEENACENPLFGAPGQECDPSLMSFMNAEQECSNRLMEQTIIGSLEPQPQICLFGSDEVTSAGGISKDSGYYIPEVETVTTNVETKPTGDWLPYELPTEMREADADAVTENAGQMASGTNIDDYASAAETEKTVSPEVYKTEIYNKETIVTRPILPVCPPETTEPEYVIETAPDGQEVHVPTCYIEGGNGISDRQTSTTSQPEVIERGNYRTADHFCIENVAPYPDMRPENLYKVRASMMSIRNDSGQENAGLLIADNLILTTADIIDGKTEVYDVETINGVKEKAQVVRINVKKNTALLQTDKEMYFRPLSLNMELPPVGRGGFMSLGLLNNAEGENYLDDKGQIKGYRFSDERGTEIITDTFVQTVSSGGALIDEKGVVTGLASRRRNFGDSGDLFSPIQDAINSVGLEVCGQAEPFTQAPTAVLKPVSSAIDGFTGSKEPAAMSAKKRK